MSVRVLLGDEETTRTWYALDKYGCTRRVTCCYATDGPGKRLAVVAEDVLTSNSGGENNQQQTRHGEYLNRTDEFRFARGALFSNVKQEFSN